MTNPTRKTATWFGVLGLLFAVPLTYLLVFLILQLHESTAHGVALVAGMSLLIALLFAASAVLLLKLSPSGRPGLVNGLLAALLGYLLFFLCLGVWSEDVPGLLATAFYVLTVAPIMWLVPAAGGISGLILRRSIG